jgi:hypothetical protein
LPVGADPVWAAGLSPCIRAGGQVGVSVRHFKTREVHKAIYATSWDGAFDIALTDTGEMVLPAVAATSPEASTSTPTSTSQESPPTDVEEIERE